MCCFTHEFFQFQKLFVTLTASAVIGVQRWYESWDDLARRYLHVPAVTALRRCEAPPKIPNSAGQGAT